MLAGMGTVLSAFFFSSIYLQDVLSHSALRTGLEFLPGALLLGGRARWRTARRAPRSEAAGGRHGLGGAATLSGACERARTSRTSCPACSSSTSASPRGFGDLHHPMASAARRKSARSPTTTTAHEPRIALVLPALSTIAASADLPTAGFGDAFRAAAALAFGGPVGAASAAPLRRRPRCPAGPRRTEAAANVDRMEIGATSGPLRADAERNVAAILNAAVEPRRAAGRAATAELAAAAGGGEADGLRPLPPRDALLAAVAAEPERRRSRRSTRWSPSVACPPRP